MSVQNTKPVILSIDDDPVVLNLLVSMLKSEYSVRPFISGRVALAYLQNQKADLILLDHQMPDMMGIDVLKELRTGEKTRDIPVIIITGAIDGDSEVEALDLGAVDYIAKPVRQRALMLRVRLQLELQKHRKHLESLVTERTDKLNTAYNKLKTREEITLTMLARVTDLRDHDTGDHLDRTTEFTRIIVEYITNNPTPSYMLSPEIAEDIVRSAKLHDVGKIALPDNILLKAGKLTPEEYAVVKTHAGHGEVFLSEFVQKMDDAFLSTARDIAYAHHERWDGSGYPRGIRGAEIPLAARIVAIADVYDALTSVRPYKRALSHDAAVRIIVAGGGTHFDPYLTEIFRRQASGFHRVVEKTQKK